MAVPIDIESAHLKRAIVNAGAVSEGHYILNGGNHALVKVDMPVIIRNPKAIRMVQDGVRGIMQELGSGVLVPVPSGGNKIAEANNHGIVKKEWTIVPRKLGPRRFEIDGEDKRYLRRIGRVALLEDVVKSGGTSGALAAELKGINPDLKVDLIGIWLRGRHEPQSALFDSQYYLVQNYIPDWKPEDCPHPMHTTAKPVA